MTEMQRLKITIKRIAPPPNTQMELTWQNGAALAKRRARAAPFFHAAHLERYTARMAHRSRKLVLTQVDIGSQVDSSLSN
jgi:hypothetical protein